MDETPDDAQLDDAQEEWLEVAGDLDAQTLEAVRLELRRLARAHGVDVAEFRVDTSGPAGE